MLNLMWIYYFSTLYYCMLVGFFLGGRGNCGFGTEVSTCTVYP